MDMAGRGWHPPGRNGRNGSWQARIMRTENDPVNAFLPYEGVEPPARQGGALAGLTFAVKDLFDVAGFPTGWGNPVILAERGIADGSSSIVERMLEAGARFVGKTQTDELAFSLNGQNMHFPEPVNPRAPGRITGGSSSGSVAAVAAGLCDFAIGSDTGGSVRAPGSYCGVWSIRPTHGRVPLDRTMPLAPSLDTPGYFADSAELFARVAPVFLGADSGGRRPDRLIVADDAFAQLLSGREAEALAPARSRIEAAYGEVENATLAEEGLAEWYMIFRRIQAYEAWRVHGAWIEARNPTMTPGVRDRFEFGRDIDDATKARLDKERAALTERVEALLGTDGVLLLPTVPSIGPLKDMPFDQLQIFRERALALLCISGLTGLPQVQMPLGTMDGCPIGLSLIGTRGSDTALVSAAVRLAGA